THAAFFHDITMTSQKLARIHTLEQLADLCLSATPEEINRFRNHPIAAADVVRKFSEVPPDVDTIITQHHERPDGTGFPRGSTASYISPLACVFILAHDFVDYVFDHREKASFEAFLESVERQNLGGNFTKIVDSLKAIRDKQQPKRSPTGRD
ncbi:MAG: HD domain-containing protein, partial [Deltaproteobacteria bacterium]|nr:HD domain-containing protein [Deltaproteobacteria bacterium]